MPAKQSTAQPDFRFYPAEGLRLLPLANLFWSFIWRITLITLLGFASYYFVSHNVVQIVKVQGMSMYPSLRNADTLYLNRWFYDFRDPRQSDIVVIKDPADQGFSVKRIVAGPGDFVCIYHGQLFVNGHKLNEPYLPENTWTFPASRPSTEWMIGCGKNEYIVLGDNRENSIDSRNYGVVPRQNILGIVFH